MKKLNKLQINPEKLMKNEELVTLRGGDYGGCPPGSFMCFCEGIFAGCQYSVQQCIDRCAW